ncbi:MAG TPA: hypothetical protein PLO37_22440 [Candidatus Hydrogenedentes bacterium]|nr:hypothetical protein [Candidatus Hydrogenedentota bacterium]HPG69615.1 hypothetical protein [Candidatus Hydrogenedentota bacterium]
MKQAARTLTLVFLLCVVGHAATADDAAVAELGAEMAAYPHRIVYESHRDGNWELILMDADGSNPVNITQTPDIDELYPHASPDGSKILFLADRDEGGTRVRDAFYMDLDGSNRVKVDEKARQPFWSPDGRTIAYAKETDTSFMTDPYANGGLYFHDVATREVKQHPKTDMAGLLNPCWAPDGNWIIASAIRAMGFNESIVAVEVHGTRVIELMRSCSDAADLHQCRPDIAPSGKQVAWGTGNTRHKDYFYIEVADIDLTVSEPKVSNRRKPLRVVFPQQTYHVEWSPDSRYIAYSQGGMGSRMQGANYTIGRQAEGWDIWVLDPERPNVVVQLTHDGLSNKEPDWVPTTDNREGDK